MNVYRPDSWIPVLISTKDGNIYKILASWQGGFADSSYWKLSSGIESVTETAEGLLEMPQSSGSSYVVSKSPRKSLLISEVLNDAIDKTKGTSVSIKEISLEDLLAAFKKD